MPENKTFSNQPLSLYAVFVRMQSTSPFNKGVACLISKNFLGVLPQLIEL